jgi:hypothetical protein
MTVHGTKFERERDGYKRCEYCGSITPQEALRRMTTPGCSFSGTDKGGYKFYFTSETGDHGKFYGAHLEDLSEEELKEWAAASRRCLGVDWRYRAGKDPLYLMPKSGTFYGWQTWGKIDPDGLPVFNDDSPLPPDEDWWKEVWTKEKEKADGK